MKKNPKKPILSDDFCMANTFEASSSTECTGLIPSAPQNEYELDSYKAILDYSPDTINLFDKNQK